MKKRLLSLLLGASLLFSGYLGLNSTQAAGIGGFEQPGYWSLSSDGTYILPNPSTLELGASGDTIPAIYVDTATIGTFSPGAITIDQDSNAASLTLDDAAQTTASVIDIPDASSLTTGGIISAISNSADTGTRNLVAITNDNTAATGATVLNVKQDAAQNAVNINHTAAAGSAALAIDQEANNFGIQMTTSGGGGPTSRDAIDILVSTITTGDYISVSSADALTTGTIANFVSNSSDASARTLVQVTNEHASADAATMMELDQDGDENALSIISDATSAGSSLVRLDMAGSATGIQFTTTGAGPTTSDAIDIGMASITTGNYIDIPSANALTSGSVINVVSNSADTGTRSLVEIINDNSAATGATAFRVQQDSTANGFTLQMNGASGNAFRIDNNSNAVGILIQDTGNTTNHVISIPSADSLTTGGIMNLVSNSADTSTRTLVNIHNDNGNAFGTTPLSVAQDANGTAVNIAKGGGGGTGLNITNAAATTGMQIGNANMTTGTGANINSNSEARTTGVLFQVQHTGSGSNADITGEDFSVITSITDTDTSGTNSLDRDIVRLSRTNIMNGAGGTMDVDGSILKIESTATETAGTLTSDVIALEIDHNSDSASDVYAIQLTHDNAGSGAAGGIDLSAFSVDEPLLKGTADSISTAGTVSHQIPVDIGGTIYYIVLYTHGS